jgi:hypothetical protein
MEGETINWDLIPITSSPLFDQLMSPSGIYEMLPLKDSIGNDAREALKCINSYSKPKGFSVSFSRLLL